MSNLIIDPKQDSRKPEAYRDATTSRRPSGFILMDGEEIAQTLQCVHCGHHFLSVRGSGITRGWCLRCNGITCGQRACDTCVPFEQKIVEYEAGVRKVLK